jgi:hypothetical protein
VARAAAAVVNIIGGMSGRVRGPGRRKRIVEKEVGQHVCHSPTQVSTRFDWKSDGRRALTLVVVSDVFYPLLGLLESGTNAANI